MTRQEYLEKQLEELEADVLGKARALESIGKSVAKKGLNVTSVYHARNTRDSLVKLSQEYVDKLTDLKEVKLQLKQLQKMYELGKISI